VIGSLLPEDLLGAVTSLLVFLDDLLARHNCHMVDCLEQRMVVVAGEVAMALIPCQICCCLSSAHVGHQSLERTCHIDAGYS
jgi:hypothetical protein